MSAEYVVSSQSRVDGTSVGAGTGAAVGVGIGTAVGAGKATAVGAGTGMVVGGRKQPEQLSPVSAPMFRNIQSPPPWEHVKVIRVAELYL